MEINLSEMPEKLISAFMDVCKSDINITSEDQVGSVLAGVKKGQRNDSVFKYGCQQFAKGLLASGEVYVLMEAKAKNCKPPLKTAEIKTCFNSAKSYKLNGNDIPKSFDGNELWHSQYKEPDWIVKGILPVGLAIVAGKPKAGKSFLSLDMMLQVSKGGELFGAFPVEKSKALYLALEDTPARLKSRMKSISTSPPQKGRVFIYNDWPEGDGDELRGFLLDNLEIKLVIIDTLAKIRPPTKTSSNLYESDYKYMSKLKKVADELNICILLVHHVRKSKSSDPFQMVSGTNGITGAADTIWVLEKNADGKSSILHIQGRDVEEQNLLLNFENGVWECNGSFNEKIPKPKELQVIKLLKKENMKSKDIAFATGFISPASANTFLNRMVEKGFIIKIEHGVYGV